MKNDFDIHQWQAKYLKENAEQLQSLADYYSSRGGGVKTVSRTIDNLISIAGLDIQTHNQLIDAITDLVDEVEKDMDY
jgi:hypothetical protein